MSPPLLNGNSTPGAARLSTTSGLFSLDHRTIIITGGLGSLGVSLAHTLLHQVADVVLTDLPQEPTADAWPALQDSAAATAIQVDYVSCDVTDELSVAEAFATADRIARHPVRGLVTCAGISGRCSTVDYPVDKFPSHHGF